MPDSLYNTWRSQPRDAKRLSRWVDVMRKQSRQREAISRLEAFTADPDKVVCAAVHAALFNLSLDEGDLGRAAELLATLQALEPESYRVTFFQGLLVARSDRHEAAKAYFLQALERKPDHLGSWTALVDCCVRTRDHVQGLHYVRRARQQPFSAGVQRFWLYREGVLFQLMARYSLALVSFTQVILDCLFAGMPEQRDKPPPLSRVPASVPLQALTEAVALLENAGLRPFPAAGTLLGWWRDGIFLTHDKDVDIMLPPGDDWAAVAAAVAAPAGFALIPNEMNYANVAALLHLETRITVDICQHEAAGEGQVTCIWRIPGVPLEQCRQTRQSAYELVRDEWLGSQFWRPRDPDRYLTELYGDWRTPQVNFDTTISGAHVVGFADSVRCYAYNRLANALSEGNVSKGLAYAAQILHKDPLDPVACRVLERLQPGQ